MEEQSPFGCATRDTRKTSESPLSLEPATIDRVTTTVHLSAPPDAVWQCLMFYEDVPRRPWPVLRLFLPQPVKSEGDKLTAGSSIRCSYERGYLIKRIARAEPCRLLLFDVVDQRLGIERYGRARHGSYELDAAPGGTTVRLTTAYEAGLRPHFVFRPLERYLCHRLHLHILFGMRDLLSTLERSASVPLGFAETPPQL